MTDEQDGGGAKPAGTADGAEADRGAAVAALEERLGHAYRDRELLATALRHRSAAQESGVGSHYERLEFLGDAVLGLLAAEWLYRRLDSPEGELSKRKSYLVSEPALALHARRLGIGDVLAMGVGEERSGGRDKPSLLADSLEALVGAAYLDGGLDAARRIVVPLLEAGAVAYGRAADHRDPKTTLQERLQEHEGGEPPDYRVVEETGPDHKKVFTVECWSAGRLLGRGQGSSKKRAEQAAAAAALEAIQGGDPTAGEPSGAAAG
jgi:ribonuclease-3